MSVEKRGQMCSAEKYSTDVVHSEIYDRYYLQLNTGHMSPVVTHKKDVACI